MFPSTSALSASSAAISSMISSGLRCAISSPPFGFFTERSKVCLVDALGVHAPALGRVGEGLLQLHELGEVGVVERVGLAEVAAGVELVEPDFARRRAFLEEEHHGLHARALERAAGAVEHGVEVAAFQQELAQAHGGVVGVGEEGVLDDHAAAPAGLEDFDEVLEEEEGGLAGADGEVLLHLLALFAAEGRIGQHNRRSGPFPECRRGFR